MKVGLEHAGVIAIIRSVGTDLVVEAAEAFVVGGVAALEVSLVTPEAPQIASELARRLSKRALVG